jgi:NAD(P)H-dependent flavin oxidoreductase YrpB (nitropropane dioxygenase family)
MTIRTRFTELFNIKHPLLSAPMGGVAGGRLAATRFLDSVRTRA